MGSLSTAINLIRRAQGQTAPNAPAPLQDWLDSAADMGDTRCEAYGLHWGYYTGDEQHAYLTDRLTEFLEHAGVGFRENFCEPMVDMVAERLHVTGFQVARDGEDGDDDGPEVDAAAYLDGFWSCARLDETQDAVHTVALAKGDAFGIVGWDEVRGHPTFSFNTPESMRAVYDDDGRMVYAVKKWDTDTAGPSNPTRRTVTRLNIYWPDRVEKWYRLHSSNGRGGWQRWMEDNTDGVLAPWPAPWVDGAGRPLGIPVVHFRNRALGREYGRSELCNVVPQQNKLNKQVIDLVAVLDDQGFPQRWVTGLDPAKASGLTAAPGTLWAAQTSDARFGQFPTADLEPAISAIENTISLMARRSGMPLHLLTGGDIPSGEAMKTAESRLVARVHARQASFGNCWEDAAMLALRLGVLMRATPETVTADMLDTFTVSVVWENPSSRDEFNEARTYEAHHRLGASRHTLLTKLGYDPADEVSYRDDEDRRSLTAMGRALDGGAFSGGFTAEDAPDDEADGES